MDSERLLREIKAHQACDHPAISKLEAVDTLEVDGELNIYFLEEFIPGGTMQENLSKGLISRPDLMNIALALSGALEHLKMLRLVHRDVKPENIMYRKTGEAVLVDLGIARHMDEASLTQTHLQMGPGTPGYAAPEQLHNEKDLIDWRTDQFSLGVTLSVAGLGMHPYSGDLHLMNASERTSQRKGQAPAFLQAAKASDLEPLIRMTQPWPIQRYMQPAELISDWGEAGGLV